MQDVRIGFVRVEILRDGRLAILVERNATRIVGVRPLDGAGLDHECIEASMALDVLPLANLADAWADTTTAHGRLIVTVLGGLAEFERELIRARTTEGRVRAVAAGVRMGRRPSLSPTQRQHAREMREAGKSLQEIGDVLGVSHITVWRITDRASQHIRQ